MAEKSLEHKCKACGKVKPRADFYQTKRGWIMQPCKPCHVRKTRDAEVADSLKRDRRCACGCGELVLKKRARFAQGHAVRSPEYAKILKNLRPGPGGKPSAFRKAGVKLCVDCGDTKPISEFYQKHHTTVKGYITSIPYHRCKACHNVICKSYAKRNREATRDYQRAWREFNAEKLKKLRRASRKRNAERNAETVKAQNRSYRYKRKSKEQGGYNKTVKHIKEAIQFTLEQARFGDQYLDAYSGELMDVPTIDHIVPLSMGGDNSLENLCVTSVENNSSKHGQPLIVWLAKRAARQGRG